MSFAHANEGTGRQFVFAEEAVRQSIEQVLICFSKDSPQDGLWVRITELLERSQNQSRRWSVKRVQKIVEMNCPMTEVSRESGIVKCRIFAHPRGCCAHEPQNHAEVSSQELCTAISIHFCASTGYRFSSQKI